MRFETAPGGRAFIRAGVGVAAAALLAAGAAFAPAASAASTPAVSLPAGFTVHLLAAAPAGAKGPDDIVRLDGKLFVAYQNGVGSKGEPSPTGATQSTVVEYTAEGRKLASWNLVGKVDGMGADPRHHRVVATVNEDGNSSLYTITPGEDRGEQLRHYSYGPKPLPHGGGTDSVVSHDGTLYVSASAPAANADGATYSQAALFAVTLSGSTAHWKQVFADNATATDAVTGKRVTLNLSDPDSSENVPHAVPRFGGAFLLDSQGDKQLIFLRGLGGDDGTRATVLNLSTQVDDTAFATERAGTLYVVDSGTGNLLAITGPFKPGEAFVSVPSDSDSLTKTLGLLDLKTGDITAFGTGLGNPKGLLFVNRHFDADSK